MEATMKDMEKQVNEEIKEQAKKFLDDLGSVEKVTHAVLKQALEGKDALIDYCKQFVPKEHYFIKRLNDIHDESQKAKLNFGIIFCGGLYELLKKDIRYFSYFYLHDDLFCGCIKNFGSRFFYDKFLNAIDRGFTPEGLIGDLEVDILVEATKVSKIYEQVQDFLDTLTGVPIVTHDVLSKAVEGKHDLINHCIGCVPEEHPFIKELKLLADEQAKSKSPIDFQQKTASELAFCVVCCGVEEILGKHEYFESIICSSSRYDGRIKSLEEVLETDEYFRSRSFPFHEFIPLFNGSSLKSLGEQSSSSLLKKLDELLSVGTEPRRIFDIMSRGIESAMAQSSALFKPVLIGEAAGNSSARDATTELECK